MDTSDLTEAEQIDLMRFLCSFAWADGEVQAREKVVLERVLSSLTLSAEGRAEASRWLFKRPDMDGFDFGAIAPDKRALFLDGAFEVAAADGGLGKEELAQLKMFMSFGKSAG